MELIQKNAKRFLNTPISVLDLAPITQGSNASETFKRSLDLAQKVDAWGFNRYWLAEHHNMPGIGSSATSIIINHIASGTKHIRVGSGGIMLPNHAPLMIAEQFGTLESLHPGRIDLGLGRAPGSDQLTARALRRTLFSNGDDFPDLVEELEAYMSEEATTGVKAYPGLGLSIPIWLLGSSGFSARLSASRGMPFSFASHFAPDYMHQAMDLYRSRFEPSDKLDKPHVMLGVSVVAADTDEEAEYLSTSRKQQMLDLMRGNPGQFKPPVKNLADHYAPGEIAALERNRGASSYMTGSPETIKQQLTSFIEETHADEIIISSDAFDHEARVRSHEIVAELLS
ncbi:LLM class flavin-dependent oxidoreductase [Alkalicoccobacillus porphyridii]|uniref:LLM class flavin-dependent oxidoreductase n=1 Tax=Alkalicoccobacillus porphyridii TaxID=2597270 RepID=A0A554A048_9BACI|nr:LLM class flavin-dependent oxidoreductase [Alkalicoccobacillus porphyridii]TSB47069.1 LLM class flavin-dependent oxidoreductase [Alkalicoccobacillus porphyridii]